MKILERREELRQLMTAMKIPDYQSALFENILDQLIEAQAERKREAFEAECRELWRRVYTSVLSENEAHKAVTLYRAKFGPPAPASAS